MLCFNHLHRTYAILRNGSKAVECLSTVNVGKNIHRQLSRVRFSSLSEICDSPTVVKYSTPKCFIVSPSRRKASNASSVADDERTQKAIESDEFRDVLRDFARDFGVTEDSLKILDDIKREQGTDDENEKKTPKDHCANNNNDETVAAYRSLVKGRYKVFKDEEATVIYSHEEESQLQLDDTFFHIDQDHVEASEKAVPKRGITGVYDIQELVTVLKEENLLDIAVIRIPESFHYADYIVLANAKSPKHAKAVSEHIVQFYKKKKNKNDPFVKVEGEKYGSWSAIDMGNIVLHIFLEDSRACYDIESLWLLDSKYDTGGQVQQDDFTEVMQEELEFFNCLQAQDSPDSNVELLK